MYCLLVNSLCSSLWMYLLPQKVEYTPKNKFDDFLSPFWFDRDHEYVIDQHAYDSESVLISLSSFSVGGLPSPC